MPLPISRVRETALVEPDPLHSESLGLPEPATLVAVEVEEGEKVKQGQLLLRFKNLSLTEEILHAEAQQQEAALVASELRGQIESQANLPPATRQDLQEKATTARERAKSYEDQLRYLREREAGFEIRAPRDGIVLARRSGRTSASTSTATTWTHGRSSPSPTPANCNSKSR